MNVNNDKFSTLLRLLELVDLLCIYIDLFMTDCAFQLRCSDYYDRVFSDCDFLINSTETTATYSHSHILHLHSLTRRVVTE